jgi:hypothetical protein
MAKISSKSEGFRLKNRLASSALYISQKL